MIGLLFPVFPSARIFIGLWVEDMLNQADMVKVALSPMIEPTLMRSLMPSRSSEPSASPETWSPESMAPFEVPSCPLPVLSTICGGPVEGSPARCHTAEDTVHHTP